MIADALIFAELNDENIIHVHILCFITHQIVVDDNEEAFQKLKSIIRNIVNSQKNQQPMFDIDFTNLKYYPTVKKRLIKIQNEIGAPKLFN